MYFGMQPLMERLLCTATNRALAYVRDAPDRRVPPTRGAVDALGILNHRLPQAPTRRRRAWLA